MEKIFWAVLSFAAGIVVGAVGYTLLSPPKPVANPSDCMNNGRSIQVEDGVAYTTYISALDECPEA